MANKKRRLPKMLHPTAIQAWYMAQLGKSVYEWKDIASGKLEIFLPLVYDMWMRDDVSVPEKIHAFVQMIIPSKDEQLVATLAFDKVDKWNNKELGKVVKAATGKELPIRNFKKEQKDIHAFVRHNVYLIKGLEEDTYRSIENKIFAGLQGGKTAEELFNEILKGDKINKGVFETARKRIEVIAYDQIGKLNSQLNEQKQREMGVDEYTWRTLQDERVRPEHAKREGVVFKWDNPPSDGHPGTAIRCRCYGEPKFKE